MNKVFRTNNSEKGFVLILLPFVLVIMLGALALMIDLTNIYSAKVKAENAVDLGVLSAVQSFITERSIQVRQGFGASGGPQVVSPTEKEYIKSRFGQSVRNNLRKNGILLNAPSGSGSLKTHLANTDLEGTIQFTPIGSENIRVTGTVELSQPLFFGGVWDHIAGSPVTRDRTVRGMASSDLLGSVFVFVLDLSSSQNCPSNSSTNCVCNTANRATVGGNCRTEAQTFGDGLLRIEEIVKATRAVASSLDRRRDRLAIIVYNNAAKMLINFGVVPAAGDPTPPGFDMAALNAALNRIVPYDAPKSSDSIFPNGNTNISDALITARDELVRANLTTDEFRKRLNVVLLTDGAPTAMRVNLASLKSSPDVAALPAVSKLPNDELPLGRNEFLAFQLTRRDGLGNFINFMSPLVEVQRYKQMIYAANGDQPYPLAPFSVTGNTDFPDSMLPDCHLNGGGNVHSEYYDLDNDVRYAKYFECISNWQQAADTYTPADKLFQGANFSYNPNNTNPGSSRDFRKLFYLSTIQAANSLASLNVRLYTLSWGTRETVPPNADISNIFTLNDVATVKSEFLVNISNDPTSSQYSGSNENYWDRSSDSGELKDHFLNPQGFSSKSLAPNGGTFIAISPDEMVSLFQKLIAQAKLSISSVSVQ